MADAEGGESAAAAAAGAGDGASVAAHAPAAGEKYIVVVTGATGFVGSHVVKQLLERGNVRVRATVRDASNAEKTAFLRSMPGADDRLELHSADLLEEGSFDKAMEGAYGCVHTAAAVKLTAKDPQKEIVDVTVNGTRNVLAACGKAGPAFKRFVQTSSIAAVQDVERPEGHVYTETDYNESATVAKDPYSVSKLQSERLAEQTAAEHGGYSTAFVNAGAIYGPILAAHHMQSSPQIVHDLMTGKFPGIPHFNFPAVDVRDVAAAHIRLLLDQPEVTGRFICVERNYSLKEIADACRQAYPQYKFPQRALPNFLMYLGAIFDSRLTFAFLRDNLNKVRPYNNSLIKSTLHMDFRDVASVSLADTCQSFIDLGVVEDLTKK